MINIFRAVIPINYTSIFYMPPYAVEPVTGVPHIRRTLVWRYLSFISKIQKSEKTSLRKLLNLVMTDVRTTTGSNLRNIMLLAGKNTIQEVLSLNTDVDYHKLEEEQNWKTILLGEIIDILLDEKTIDGLETQELEDILEFVCIG